MTENENKLIKLIRKHPYPDKAILVAIQTILLFLMQQ